MSVEALVVFRFAYGQTGSGKTFTLFGPENDTSLFASASAAPEKAGIIPRAVRYAHATLE